MIALPLLAIAAIFAFGMAGTAKAQPKPKKKTTAKAKPVRMARTRQPRRRVTISKRKAPKSTRVRRRRPSRRRRRIEQIINKRVKRIAAQPVSAKGRQMLSKLIEAATSRRQPRVVRKAAGREIKKITAKPVSARAAAINRLPTRAKTAIAKAVIKADKAPTVTADQAARALRLWTKQGGNQGTRNNRSETVRRHQLAMGFTGKDADGIIGPATRKRARSLGYPLYSRRHQKPGAVGVNTVGYCV